MKHTLAYSHYVRSITLRVNIPNFKGILNIMVNNLTNKNYHMYDREPVKHSILTYRLKF